MLRAVVLLSMMFMLSGCYQWLAQLEKDALRTYEAANNFLTENVQDRKAIRNTCRIAVAQRYNKFLTDGKHQRAYDLLYAAYPPLITKQMIDDGVDAEAFNEAHMCKALKEFGE